MIYCASDMMLTIDSDAAYLVAPVSHDQWIYEAHELLREQTHGNNTVLILNSNIIVTQIN